MRFSKFVKTKSLFDVEEKVWKGPNRQIKFDLDVSLGRLMFDSLQKHPEHISQICDNNGKQYTNKEILTMSIRMAQRLEDMGIQQNDVIGICGANTDYVAPLVVGVLLCGATLSTLDPSFDKDGIQHIFSITRPKLMFCDGEVYSVVQASLSEIEPSIQIYTMKDHLKGVQQIQELITPTGKERSFTMKKLEQGSSQVAAIVCSSGTTGLPKGVCMSHESVINSNIFEIDHNDKLLCFSTLYWASGLLCLLHGTMTGCTRVITDQRYSPELFLRIVEQYKINLTIAPPSQMALAIRCPDLQKRNLSSLEAYICGGSAVPYAVVQEFKEQVKGGCVVIICYGMSEISGACCFGVHTQPGANGQVMPNITIKVVDDTGKQLGIGEKGEICIKTPFQWAGYYGNPKATSEIYHQDGYIHSGDLGYFDDQGSLLIVDRKKDILKYNNFHFFPTEIEEIITQIPDVVEVCVCGIPDIISSFLPAAAIVKVPGSNLAESDVANYVAERMAHFKHLRGGVYFLDSLPKTASGKNIRDKVCKILENLIELRQSSRSGSSSVGIEI